MPVPNEQDSEQTNTSQPQANFITNESSAPSEVEPPTSSLSGGQPAPATSYSSAAAGRVGADADAPTQTGSFAQFGAAATPAATDVENDSSQAGVGLTVAPKKSNKKRIVAAVVAGVVTLLVACGVAAYALWYQNPDKVLGEALANALLSESAKTDTKLKITSGEGDDASTYNVGLKTINDLKDARADLVVSSGGDSVKYNISGSVIVKNNEKLFIKIDKLKELLEQSGMIAFLGSSQSAMNLVTKLDSNWVVVTKEEIEENTGTKDQASKCIETAVEKLRTDENYSNQLEDLYKKYPLIGVKQKLGSKDGSLGYEIKFNRENAVKFANGVNATKFYSDLKKCDEKIEDLKGEDIFEEDDSSKKDDTKVVVWVDRWSHQFTKLEVTGKSDDSAFTMTTTTKFDEPVKVEAPKKAITIDELKSDIEAIQQEMMQANEAATEESNRFGEEMNILGESSRT